MFRAGRMTHVIDLYKLKGGRNAFGEVVADDYVHVFRTRAAKKKLYVRVYKDDIKAKEEFFSSNVSLIVRAHPLLKEATALRFAGDLYIILYFDPNDDGSYTLGLRKTDE